MSADNASIFTVAAVLNAPTVVTTLVQTCFNTGAAHVIQPDLSGALTKSSSYGCRYGPAESQLVTDYAGVVYVPRVVANGSPLAVMEYFHATFMGS